MLADALIAAGDPRGELITLQAELAKRPHDRDLAVAESKAKAGAWGDLTPFRRYFRKSSWRLGFVDEIDLHPHAPPEVIATLASSPVARWLRSLKWVNLVKPEHLSSFVNLRSLEVGAASTEAQFHAYAALPHVIALEVNGALSVEAIKTVPGALQSLHLAYIKPCTDDHIAATAHIHTLRELIVRNTFTITDAAFSRLGDGVRSLAVRRCKTTNAIFGHVARQRLTKLLLNPDGRIDGGELARLEGGTLEGLWLYSVGNPERLLAALAAHRGLEEAELGCALDDRSPVNAETLGRVLASPKLRRFGIRFRGVLEGDVLPDTSATAINLHVGGVSPGFAAALARLPLTELHLIGSEGHNEWVDDRYLSQVAANAALEHLDVSQTNITDAGLRALHGHPRIAKLELGYCGHVTSRGLADLVSSLPALRELDINHAAADASVIAAAASRPNLRVLNLSFTKIADADLAALLPAAATLRDLDLTGCPIKVAAVPALGQLHALDRVRIGLEHEIAAQLRPLIPQCFVEV